VITWHRYVLCHPSPTHRCDATIRRAKNVPYTISIHRNVCLPVSVVITWHRNVPQDSKHKTGIYAASDHATVIEIPFPTAWTKDPDPGNRLTRRSGGGAYLYGVI